MNKFIKYYIIDSIIFVTLGILVYFLIKNSFFSFFEVYPLTIALGIFSILSLIFNIISLLLNRVFKEDNPLFAKFILIFFIIIVILSLIMSRYMLDSYLHTGYYYGFISFNYLLLSLYTSLSFEYKTTKKKNKKNK